MQPDSPQFPLTALPYLAHKHVIGSMPTTDIVSYSLTSDYSKFIVRSLRFAAKQLVVRIDKTEVKIIVINKADPNVHGVSITCRISAKLPFGHGMFLLDCKKPLSPREWLCHFMDIFNCKNLEVRFEKVHQKTSNFAKKLFEGVHVEQLYVTDDSGKFYQKVIAAMAVNKVTLRVRDFFQRTTIDCLFHAFILVYADELSFKMKGSLDCNALNLEVYQETTTYAINDFLRRWIKSPNPKLQSMKAHVQFSRGMNNDLFDGINFTQTRSEGIVYSIQSKNGTNATIRQSFRWKNRDFKCYFTFSVLRD